MHRIAKKMVQDAEYEKDIVITFIRGNYYKPTKRTSDEDEVAKRDEVYTTPFHSLQHESNRTAETIACI